MASITQDMRYRLSFIKYADKYGVSKAAIKYKTNRQYIYCWKRRYDSSMESLRDRSRRPYHHPNQHTLGEITLIRNMRRRNPDSGLVIFLVKLRQRGYSHWRFVEAFEEHSTYSSAMFLEHLVKSFPCSIECVQTDNGPEFTNRFTTYRDKPTLFQKHLEQHGIVHKLIRPYTPRHNVKVGRSYRKSNEYFYATHSFFPLRILQSS